MKGGIHKVTLTYFYLRYMLSIFLVYHGCLINEMLLHLHS